MFSRNYEISFNVGGILHVVTCPAPPKFIHLTSCVGATVKCLVARGFLHPVLANANVGSGAIFEHPRKFVAFNESQSNVSQTFGIVNFEKVSVDDPLPVLETHDRFLVGDPSEGARAVDSATQPKVTTVVPYVEDFVVSALYPLSKCWCFFVSFFFLFE